MNTSSLSIMACPSCCGPLVSGAAEDEVIEGSLKCTTEGLVFPVRDGIPWLVHPGQAERIRILGEEFSRVWRREGWGDPNPTYLLNLPYKDLTGRQSSKWRMKSRSMAALLSLMGGLKPRRVLDLGAGVGWLSHHLSRKGYEVFAADILADDVLGLGAAKAYFGHGSRFERVLADFLQPPFTSSSFDAVVCNASLHYAVRLNATLDEVARILRPGGSFIVMNSPVHRNPISAQRAQSDFRRRLRASGAPDSLLTLYTHFVRREIIEVLEKHIGPTKEVPFNPGVGFRLLRWLKGIALGMEFASFPILVSSRQVGATA